MKKILSLILTLSAVLCFGFSASSADLGYGAQVVANDVTMIKTGLIGQKICFNDADFKSALVLDDFDTITVTEIPSSTEGTLLLAGRRVGKGRVIKRKNLGTLVFIPASDTVNECSFKFTVEGYAGGAEIECILKFIDKVNYAPEAGVDAVEASVTTQESILYYGNMTSSDPEGDKVEYIIVSYPTHGTISVVDKESGRYCYTPIASYTGKDKFRYVARDEYGNYSKPVTVNVRVVERMCQTEYRDMTERDEYNAAVAMTAMGVMAGKLVGDDLYFQPEETVTRAEFVAMAMKCAGIRADSTLAATYFDDDGDIPQSLKGYIATAQRIGLVNGDFKDGQLTFSPNEEITKYEAAKILSNLIGADGEGEESSFTSDSDIPVWARGAVTAMYTLRIFEMTEDMTLTDSVTRASAASYLYRIMDKV